MLLIFLLMKTDIKILMRMKPRAAEAFRQRPKGFGGSLNFTESVSYLM